MSAVICGLLLEIVAQFMMSMIYYNFWGNLQKRSKAKKEKMLLWFAVLILLNYSETETSNIFQIKLNVWFLYFVNI